MLTDHYRLRSVFSIVSLVLILCLAFSACRADGGVTVDGYLDYYKDIGKTLGFESDPEIAEEDGLIAFSAFDGLFSVGIVDNGGDIIYASVSVSNEYAKELCDGIDDEKDLERAVLSAAYLVFPFYKSEGALDKTEIATLGGLILSSFDEDIMMGSIRMSAKKKDSGFTVSIF